MEKRKWLWKRKSSLDKSPGESETSGSMSSQSEKYSEDQEKGSPNHSTRSPEVNSKELGDECNKENKSTSKNSLLKKLTEANQEDFLENNSTVDESVSDGSSNHQVGHRDEETPNGKEENESVKLLKDKLSAALINVSLKDELVKQHTKVAEEAVDGWEKAENEVAVLKQELDTAVQENSALEARFSHVDQALKECVRQLRLAKDEQDRKISEALAEKSKEFELTKSKLESQIVELEASIASSVVVVDPEIHLKLEFLERENQRLEHELMAQCEELEIRTIERDLSTKAAETASKQHLESIKMVAKLESECRKLKALSRKSLVVDKGQKSPSIDSVRSLPSKTVEIDLMDDFLEMEKLAALPENGHHPKSESPEDQSELLRVAELEEKMRKMEDEKIEIERASSQSQLELIETKMKLEQLEAELREANELKMDYESYASDLKLEAQAMMSKIEQLQAEVDRQRVSTEKLSSRCQELENELCMKTEELEIQQGKGELEEKEKALAESRKQIDELENQIKETKMKLEKQEVSSRSELEEKEMALAENLKCLEELQIKLKEAEMKLETQNAVHNSEVEKKETELEEAENKLEKLQKELHEENESKERLLLELNNIRAEVETMSTQINTLHTQIDKEHSISGELSVKCEELRNELKQKEQELELRQNVPALVEQKKNQEELVNAAGKLAECQKTIASLGNQLKSLATLEDFLIDTASIPAFSGSAPLIKNVDNEMWKLHSSNHFRDPEEGLHTFSKYVDGDMMESSSSSTNLFSCSNSEKRGNGFEKLFPMRRS